MKPASAACLGVLVMALLGAGARGQGGEPARERAVAELVSEADAALERGEYERARSLYRQAVERRPDALHALRRLASLQARAGDLVEAAASYRRALALAPGDRDLALELAAVLSRKSDHDDAVALCRGLRAERPADPRVLLALGGTLVRAGRLKEAWAIYEEMEQRRIEPIEAHLGLAGILTSRGELEEAARFYRDVLRADPANLAARIGIARVNHRSGLDRAAREQINNIVVEFPHETDALDLQREILDALRPRARGQGARLDDDGDNRVGRITTGTTFMAEPQTSIDVALSILDADFRCRALALCDEVAAGPAVDRTVTARAQVLRAELRSRIVRPLVFSARLALVREEDIGGGERVVPVGGGHVRWQVGRRLALLGSAARRALLDTTVLIDRGIRVDRIEARIEFRFAAEWRLSGAAGYALYSDGNDRAAASMGIEWRVRASRPSVSGSVDLRYRGFGEDLDNGYFDPLRYDSEALSVAVWDEYPGSGVYWRLRGTYGRQDFDTGPGERIEAADDDTVQVVRASAGIRLGSRASLEAFYVRSHDPLERAVGFPYERSGLSLRVRF
ncbi:MAG: tetratricopeptide repeat protein [Acidobacteriota bacterium]